MSRSFVVSTYLEKKIQIKIQNFLTFKNKCTDETLAGVQYGPEMGKIIIC